MSERVLYTTRFLLENTVPVTRKRSREVDDEELPPRKRRRCERKPSKFQQRCLEWKQKRRNMLIGLRMYEIAMMNEIRRLARKRPSDTLYELNVGRTEAKLLKLSEVEKYEPGNIAGKDKPIKPTQVVRKIKKLSSNEDAVCMTVIVPVAKRQGWRRRRK